MVVFLIGKITDNEKAETNFAKAEGWLKLHDYKVINVLKVQSAMPTLTEEQSTQVAFDLIRLADSVFMVNGWQYDKRAYAQLSYAKSLGKKIVYLQHYKEFKNHKKGETNNGNQTNQQDTFEHGVCDY